MKNNLLAAFSILLLLAVAGPSCLAAENSTTNQQPAPQDNKLQPSQFTANPLAQKEYFQAPLQLAQQHPPIATTAPKPEDPKPHANEPQTSPRIWPINLSISITGESLGAISAIIVCIISSIITVRTSRATSKNALEILNVDIKNRKNEQERAFSFQTMSIAREEKKKLCLDFLTYMNPQVAVTRDYDNHEISRLLYLVRLLLNKEIYTEAFMLCNILQLKPTVSQYKYSFLSRTNMDDDDDYIASLINTQTNFKYAPQYEKVLKLMTSYLQYDAPNETP